MNLKTSKIAVIGLGYVGLPLAVEFGRKRSVIGFDIDAARVSELERGTDRTLEVDADELASSTGLTFTSDIQVLKEASIFIVTVPTPIDEYKQPDLTPLRNASKIVGSVLKKDDLVIYESTVFPGATEEQCVPILEATSSLSYNSDFFCGYSPERINPGDRAHRLVDIKKVTAGSTPQVAELVTDLYNEIITAGTYQAQSIRVAEAAKVIENTQRDLNIALVNELAMIFNRLGIETEAVLEAAGTKWNFLPFRPGLVGGHCIGVDPYYLTHKAQAIGYHPDVILAGRRINDGMGVFVAGELVKAMLKHQLPVNGARVLILGMTFKENCPDLRNTGVVQVLNELQAYGVDIEVCDPWANAIEAKQYYDVDLVSSPKNISYDAILIAVAHDEFRSSGVHAIRAYGKPNHILYDLKCLFEPEESDLRL